MTQVSIQADKSLTAGFGEAAYDCRAKTPFADPHYEPNRVSELTQFFDRSIRSISAVIIDNDDFIGSFRFRHRSADSPHERLQVLHFLIRRYYNTHAQIVQRLRSATHRSVLPSSWFAA